MLKRFLPSLVFACLVAAFLVWLLNRPFWQAVLQVSSVMRVLHEQYVEEDRVSYDKLAQAAVSGMVGSLDKYSQYIPTADFSRFEELTDQRYVGVGIQIEAAEGGGVQVAHVFPGGPAADAGIQVGDRIEAVGTVDVSQLGIREVSTLLRGEAGGEVAVRLYRTDADGPVQVMLVRREVDVPSVQVVPVDSDGVGRINIRQFGDRTPDEFHRALDDLEAQGLRGLIVDLRDNPGGVLRAAKEVAAEFFRKGQLIVYLEGRGSLNHEEFRARRDGRLGTYPIAVLINEGSASAAEIVAGVWQDVGRAVVVGEKSHGKGSVQSVYAFPGGDGVRATTARYFFPSGKSIDAVGVKPDIEVPLEGEAERAVRRQNLLMSTTGAAAVPDPQLDAARQALRQSWAATSPLAPTVRAL